ncbi:BREX-1 system adenine-specific DNA-methyltransferase PglX [Allochromatium humboldtianum]|uniref:site-specific DNA-methyltransferase (adenine-specific) n=1 Tax=Allochromatium humboldtianum TaxID=504901 RepID=A0A850RAK5_9GAMM|nr:BREX-1 system adenine-specific DNA-methyltransferase PglX [Allochromatium humboldtianum]NVZ09785.1 BREX-1 system adenine-specific DNA-methyltransferase PglX [Allochromatium humboldtianum]
MQTAKLKTYAPKARRDFIAAVMRRAATFGLTAQGVAPQREEGQLIFIDGRAYPRGIGVQRQKLAARIERQGFQAVMESAAYTWFNRFIAIRFMELHGYLEHSFRVLSHPAGGGLPEILEQAQHVELPGLDRARVLDLKLDGTRDEELYRDLLLAQCRALHRAMPFLFEPIDDETELLLPDNLLQTDSLIRELVTAIPEEDWQEVEIIGWLYQFYISEKKDQVIGKVVRSEDIPAATQLFTPNWIVQYMVQNSLGAQWLATYPDSALKGQMAYYIEPAEQTAEVKAQIAAITPESLNPEELTLIDPACGSGHILVEAYELFKAIYLERGYRLREIPQLILERNLYGLDIDERAAQLAGFALMMKARADDRRLFERRVTLDVMALQESKGLEADELAQILGAVGGLDATGEGRRAPLLGVAGDDLFPDTLPQLSLGEVETGRASSEAEALRATLAVLIETFAEAKTFGSLIQVPEALAEKLPELRRRCEVESQDLFVVEALRRLRPLVQQAELLAKRYDAVVTNPPYMGNKGMNAQLKKFMKQKFPGSNSDLFAASATRFLQFSKLSGFVGLMTPFTLMFLKSYSYLREIILGSYTLRSLIQPEYHSFFDSAFVPICTFVVKACRTNSYEASFIRLSDFYGAELQSVKAIEAIRNPACGWYYCTKTTAFEKLPGLPFVYWISEKILKLFSSNKLLGDVCESQAGICTTDNNRFLRFWHEVAYDSVMWNATDSEAAQASGRRWFPHNKGGGFRKWWGNHDYIVDWEDNGSRIKALVINKYDYLNGDPNFVVHDYGNYFKPFASWSEITSDIISFRLFPLGFTSNYKGMCVFQAGDTTLEQIVALCNSRLTAVLCEALNPTLSFGIGNFRSLPAALVEHKIVAPIVSQLVSIARLDWDLLEVSWKFQSVHILTSSSGFHPNIKSSYTAWITQNRTTIAEMKRLEEENNRLFIDAYGLQDELTPEVPIDQITLTVNPAYRYGKKLTNDEWSVEHGFPEELETRFREDTMRELVSYAIGCMMGRYSLDEPGLIYAHAGNQGFDPNRYRTFSADADGILPITELDWFDNDAAHRLVEFIAVAWDRAHLEDNLSFLAANLSPKKDETSRDTLRRYLSDGFFKHHLQTYKRRPIYWCFSSGKLKAFQCLVYLHRYHEGTLARLRMEYVVPLQSKLTARIDRLADDIAAAATSAQTKRLQKERDLLTRQLDELRQYDEKLRHAADQRIRLDLDDGVKVNYGKFGDLLAEVKTVTGQTSD